MIKRKLVVMFTIFSLGFWSMMPVYAEDYSDTEAWYEKCSKAQTSQAGVDACQAFQDYQNQKKESLQASIEQWNEDIKNLETNSDEIEALAKQQKELITSLESEIAEKERSISLIEENIEKLKTKIEAKQKKIDKWNAQIEKRMRSEQTNTGTNMVIDMIMGSDSLSDMLRRISGLERITEDDQSQIEKLNKLKEELELQKAEQDRLDEQTKAQKADLEEQKAQASALEESYNALVEQYQAQIVELEAKKREAQQDISSIKSFVISSNFSGGSIVSVAGFINPIPAGHYSAGTWAYSSGGLHLGLDWAASIGSEVLAPANGIIIYANNPVGTNSGYLGNFSGYPYGGGNTIQMLCSVNGTLYAVSFFHLSNTFYVSTGQSVTQGQTIALSGNSGNSTGPHTHIEVINLGSMSVDDAVAQFSKNADFAWTTGWSSTSTACDNGKAAPCRERPEKFFS